MHSYNTGNYSNIVLYTSGDLLSFTKNIFKKITNFNATMVSNFKTNWLFMVTSIDLISKICYIGFA